MLAQTEATDAFPFDNSYARLQSVFAPKFSPPPPLPRRCLIQLNENLARQLRLGIPYRLSYPEGIAMLAGNVVPKLGDPLAMAYAGHQFGAFCRRLGDGRAIFSARCRPDGERRDIQLKGAGRTPFSRRRRRASGARAGPARIRGQRGDGRAGHVPRRALSLRSRPEKVGGRATRPCLVRCSTRVASSHVRVGTFEFSRRDRRPRRAPPLAGRCLTRHYPRRARADDPDGDCSNTWSSSAGGAVGEMAASLGFIHGVMNTDNTSIAGETIDYGPCAFMDAYGPATVYGSQRAMRGWLPYE